MWQTNFNGLRRQLATLHARFYAILFFILFLVYFLSSYLEVRHIFPSHMRDACPAFDPEQVFLNQKSLRSPLSIWAQQ